GRLSFFRATLSLSKHRQRSSADKNRKNGLEVSHGGKFYIRYNAFLYNSPHEENAVRIVLYCVGTNRRKRRGVGSAAGAGVLLHARHVYGNRHTRARRSKPVPLSAFARFQVFVSRARRGRHGRWM